MKQAIQKRIEGLEYEAALCAARQANLAQAAAERAAEYAKSFEGKTCEQMSLGCPETNWAEVQYDAMKRNRDDIVRIGSKLQLLREMLAEEEALCGDAERDLTPEDVMLTLQDEIKVLRRSLDLIPDLKKNAIEREVLQARISERNYVLGLLARMS